MRLICAILTAWGLCVPAFAGPPEWPLKVAENRRYLEDATSAPFFLHADAPSSLMVALTKEEVETYLENRRSKGFNALVVELIENFFSGAANPYGSPKNRYGEGPFTTLGDFRTRNEAYFAHADWVIDRAAAKGMVVLLNPCYLGFPGSAEGWYPAAMANGVDACKDYGRFVGNRYKSRGNIIWTMVGDRDPGDATLLVEAMVEGIREVDDTHLFTAHCIRGSSPRAQFPESPWLKLNNAYSAHPVQDLCLAAYQMTPNMPYILIEGHYENEHGIDAERARAQAYSAILAGACGHVFGNRPIWLFDTGWEEALDGPGSVSMKHVKRLFQSRSWEALIPDLDHRIITTGYGNGLSWVGCARTQNGATIIAYLPSTSSEIIMDLSYLAGGQARVWWFNPRDGKATAAGLHPTGELRTFSRPTSEDWVLVIDDASLNLRPPGSPDMTLKIQAQAAQDIQVLGFRLSLEADIPGTYAIEQSTDMSAWETMLSFDYESGWKDLTISPDGNPQMFFRATPLLLR